MSVVRCFHVDSFTEQPFAGNPAAVCLLEEERDANWMHSVAAELNLSETAFVRSLNDGFQLRWFTPATEVDLCGHATLASAHVLSNHAACRKDPIRFHTRSGLLTATRRDELIELDFPATPAESAEPPADLLESLGVNPVYLGQSKFDLLVVVESEEEVRSLAPDFARLRQVATRGVIVTSTSADCSYDFVSRFFAPAAGIDEDPVTGSAHCCLGPYWSERLGKTELRAFQASARGGDVQIRVSGDRVYLGGQAVTVMQGELADTRQRLKQQTDTRISFACRPATRQDVPGLARMNQQLIEDEASRNPMTLGQLEERMAGWLEHGWQAVLFEQAGDPVGYMLFRFRQDEYQPSDTTVFVRQFFVARDHRGQGIGRVAFQRMVTSHFQSAATVSLDVLETNQPAFRFWKSLGFRAYCTALSLKL